MGWLGYTGAQTYSQVEGGEAKNEKQYLYPGQVIAKKNGEGGG